MSHFGVGIYLTDTILYHCSNNAMYIFKNKTYLLEWGEKYRAGVNTDRASILAEISKVILWRGVVINLFSKIIFGFYPLRAISSQFTLKPCCYGSVVEFLPHSCLNSWSWVTQV